MRLHLLHAGRLAGRLAADRVDPPEQAAYFAVTFIAWLCTSYLLSLPPAFGSPRSFFTLGLWYSEFVMLVLVNWAGAYYCLRQCLHDPRRHFLVDLTCLSAPANIIALVGTWAAYYAAIWGCYGAALALDPESQFTTTTYWRIHDVFLYLVVVGQVALAYLIAARYMRRAAVARLELR